MGPKGHATRDGALAVRKQGGMFRRDFWSEKHLVLITFQQGPVEEGDLGVQEVHITGGPDVVSDDKGKPQEVIGDPRADSRAARWMPPVLDISLFELTARRE